MTNEEFGQHHRFRHALTSVPVQLTPMQFPLSLVTLSYQGTDKFALCRTSVSLGHPAMARRDFVFSMLTVQKRL